MIEQNCYSNKTLFTKRRWRARFGAQIHLAILNHAGLTETAWEPRAGRELVQHSVWIRLSTSNPGSPFISCAMLCKLLNISVFNFLICKLKIV